MTPPDDAKTAGDTVSATNADMGVGEVQSVMQGGVEKWPLGHEGQHDDVAYDMFEESLRMDAAERDIIAKRVLLKLDLIVLPMVSR